MGFSKALAFSVEPRLMQTQFLLVPFLDIVVFSRTEPVGKCRRTPGVKIILRPRHRRCMAIDSAPTIQFGGHGCVEVVEEGLVQLMLLGLEWGVASQPAIS